MNNVDLVLRDDIEENRQKNGDEHATNVEGDARQEV